MFYFALISISLGVSCRSYSCYRTEQLIINGGWTKIVYKIFVIGTNLLSLVIKYFLRRMKSSYYCFVEVNSKATFLPDDLHPVSWHKTLKFRVSEHFSIDKN